MKIGQILFGMVLGMGAAVHLQAQQPAQPAAQAPAAQSLAAAINSDRADRGLGPLHWDPALAAAAQEHAELMATQGGLSHQFSGEAGLAERAGQQGAHFRLIEENVAMGPSALQLEKQWMNSAPHRANILNQQVNAIGIGLVERGGYTFGVADFAESVASVGPQQVEAKIVALLKQRGIPSAQATRDARQTCEMAHGTAGASSPRFVMRWEGTDLSRLPAVLDQKLASGQFHGAAVGACDSGRPSQGFTSYRLAVMLY